MKFACFGDLHSHKFKEFDVRTDWTGSKRLDNILRTLLSIRSYCVDNNIKYVLGAGDIYNVRAKVDIEVQNYVYDVIKTFSEFGITVILIAGNHDQYDNSDYPANALHVFKDLPMVHVYGSEGVHTVEEGSELVDIVCVPYNKDAVRIKEFIGGIASTGTYGERDLVNPMLLFHLGISGGFQGMNSYPLAEAFNLEDLHPDYFKYCVGGHFHKRQFLGGLSNVFYCGAPIQHSHNDEGEDKGFYVIDTSKRCDISFVHVPNPQFRTITGDTTQEELAEYSKNGDYLRVKLKDNEVQDFISRVPQELNFKTEIEKEYTEETRVAVKIGMSFEQIISTYADEYMPEAKEVGISIFQEVGGK